MYLPMIRCSSVPSVRQSVACWRREQVTTADNAVDTLQGLAENMVPETTLNAITKAGAAAANITGTTMGAKGSDFLAVSQGKIFNPYEEIIFKGMNFEVIVSTSRWLLEVKQSLKGLVRSFVT